MRTNVVTFCPFLLSSTLYRLPPSFCERQTTWHSQLTSEHLEASQQQPWWLQAGQATLVITRRTLTGTRLWPRSPNNQRFMDPSHVPPLEFNSKIPPTCHPDLCSNVLKRNLRLLFRLWIIKSNVTMATKKSHGNLMTLITWCHNKSIHHSY